MDLTRTPLHDQIKEILRERIKKGVYTEKIPGELSLMEEFSVSRTTIREAISGLVQEGILDKVHGKGTFVKNKPLFAWLGALHGFSESMQHMGYTPTAKLIRFDIIKDKEISKILLFQEIYLIERLRLIDGVPIAIERDYFPPFIGEKLKGREEETFYTIFEDELSIRLNSAQEIISAAAANKAQAELLHVEVGSPLLQIYRTTYSSQDEPIEILNAVYRSDFYNFKIDLKRAR